MNVLGGPLLTCSDRPLTGFFRDGCCNTSEEALGSHTICVLPTAEFLEFSKARGNVFLDRLDELLQARGVTVRRYRKPTFTRPAPLELAQKIAAECHLVVEGLAD